MTKDEFAVLYVQESMIFRLAEQVEFKGALGKLNSFWANRVEKLSKEVGDAYTYDIKGYSDDLDLSYYDVEQAVVEEFKDNVIGDSYSGALSISVKNGFEKKVKEFIESKFPSVKTTLDNDISIVFANWDAGIKYCKENNITVGLPTEVTEEMLLQVRAVNELKEEVENNQNELNNFINNL
jgi:hypothetical protein